MNNLFIMHTQYNLILASAIISRHSNDNNVLVLFAEFTVKSSYIEQLERIYNKVIIANDTFKKFSSKKSKLDFIKKCVKKCSSIFNDVYDNVYLSQEREFDLILLNKMKKNNKKLVSYNVEEDAYYSINNKFNAPNYVHKVTLGEKLKNFLKYCYLFKYKYDYKEPCYCYGMYSGHKGANLLFPELARKELCEKNNIEITSEELIYGIKSLYSSETLNYPRGQKYFLVFFDLVSRYRNKSAVIGVIKDMVGFAQKDGYTVILKYHPRETEKIFEFKDLYEVDNTIPAEKLLLDMLGKEVAVLGNATTSVVVAAKLGYKVYSICSIDAPENTTMKEVMTRMGINCIV